MWFTQSTANTITAVNMSGTLVRTVTVPTNPTGIINGPDGKLWFTCGNGFSVGTLSTSGQLNTLGGLGYNYAITAGPDGNMWYLDQTNDAVVKTTPTLKVLASYPLSGLNSNQIGITVGPDGNIWLAENAANLIAKVTLNGSITTYATAAGSTPTDIIVGPDGNLWFTNFGNDTMGEITTSGVKTIYTTANGLSAGGSPEALLIGPDGNIWFSDFGNNAIGKFIL
jgi:streptogramin lyase